MLYRIKLALILFLFSGCASYRANQLKAGYLAGKADYAKMKQNEKIPNWRQGYLIGVTLYLSKDLLGGNVSIDDEEMK